MKAGWGRGHSNITMDRAHTSGAWHSVTWRKKVEEKSGVTACGHLNVCIFYWSMTNRRPICTTLSLLLTKMSYRNTIERKHW